MTPAMNEHDAHPIDARPSELPVPEAAVTAPGAVLRDTRFVIARDETGNLVGRFVRPRA